MSTRHVTSAGPTARAATPAAGELQSTTLHHQRERLLAAVVEIVADNGYARASIGELARRASVSRGTFYELFHDKADCFLCAFAEQESQLKRALGAGERDWPDRALEAVLERLICFAGDRPRSFDFLFHEALLAGPEASRRRDQLGRWILGLVREREARAGGALAPVAAPLELILGGVLRLVTMNSRRGTLDPLSLGPELTNLVTCYRATEAALQWRTLEPVAGLTREPATSGDPEVLRRSVPKGRHGLSPDALRALHRERIAYGTAVAIHGNGYAEATVSDIVAAAGVSRDVFYAEFRDKHEAFGEAAKLVFEQLLARMASAYYGTTAPWPERVWVAGEAFARFLEDYPVLAHFLFVGTSSPRPQVDRVNEYVLAFKLFIDDGFAYAPTVEVPEVASELIVCAVLAVVTYQIREERVRELRGLIPTIVYTVICPFLGHDEAGAFIAQRTRVALASA